MLTSVSTASKKLSWLVCGLTKATFKERIIKGVTCDSRKVKAGYIFVAITGNKLNGSAFIADSIKKGAVAIVSEKRFEADEKISCVNVSDARKALSEISCRFYDDPSSKIKVIGITGTNGKTTTSFILKAILESANEKVGLIGTISYQLGRRIIHASTTTPGADDLQKYLAEMEKAGCSSAVMEASSHSLTQHRTSDIKFAAGIFTNITRDHFDYHKTFENYQDAKANLFRGLSEKALAILNADDPSCDFMAQNTRARVCKFGVKNGADIWPEIHSADFSGTKFTMHLGKESVAVNSKLIGLYNVYNILAASCCAWNMGYDLEVIVRGIEKVENVPGRLEPVSEGQDFAVMVDYAHTDDALKNVMSCLRPLLTGKLILVFGCGGDRDRGKRPRMGKAAEELADCIIITSDNPRSEEPIEIIKEIEIGIDDKAKYVVEVDRKKAIEMALSAAKCNDIVLIAGKGHETYQIFRDKTIKFDDREIAKKFLRKLVKKNV